MAIYNIALVKSVLPDWAKKTQIGYFILVRSTIFQIAALHGFGLLESRRRMRAFLLKIWLISKTNF